RLLKAATSRGASPRESKDMGFLAPARAGGVPRGSKDCPRWVAAADVCRARISRMCRPNQPKRRNWCETEVRRSENRQSESIAWRAGQVNVIVDQGASGIRVSNLLRCVAKKLRTLRTRGSPVRQRSARAW